MAYMPGKRQSETFLEKYLNELLSIFFKMLFLLIYHLFKQMKITKKNYLLVLTP